MTDLNGDEELGHLRQSIADAQAARDDIPESALPDDLREADYFEQHETVHTDDDDRTPRVADGAGQ